MEEQLQKIIIKNISDHFGIEVDEIKLTFPPKKNLGDFCFHCGLLSKHLRKNPIEIAKELSTILEKDDIFDEATEMGPYVNFKVSKSIFVSQFSKMYSDIEGYLSPKKGAGQTIVIDYIGANVGKTLHIGHMCTPNQGQVMVNLYKKLGYNVISDSHIGDWGIIFGKLITAYKHWGDESRLEENAVDYLLELYVRISKEVENSPELEQQTRDEFKLLSSGNEESKIIWSNFTSYSITAMNKLLDRLNVKPDYNIGESFYEGLGLKKMENNPDLTDDMHTIVQSLVEKQIATKNEDNSVGVVFPDETKLSSCILQKRDGTHGYLASDLACIYYRMTHWSPSKIIYFVDLRQKLHFEQAFEVAKSANWLQRKENNDTELIHAYNGSVSGKDGAFSSRKGNIIKLSDLLDEAESRAKDIILEKRDDIEGSELEELSKIIGIGAIKYGYLKKSRDTDVIFDWDEFMTFEGNSGPYIQYAYVRAKRILEKYGNNISKEITGQFETAQEVELVKILGTYQSVLIKTGDTNMPHHLCKYAFDVTKIFNSFYNSVHILNEEDENKKIIRLQLVELFTKNLKDVFGLLGIDMPEKM